MKKNLLSLFAFLFLSAFFINAFSADIQGSYKFYTGKKMTPYGKLQFYDDGDNKTRFSLDYYYGKDSKYELFYAYLKPISAHEFNTSEKSDAISFKFSPDYKTVEVTSTRMGTATYWLTSKENPTHFKVRSGNTVYFKSAKPEDNWRK